MHHLIPPPTTTATHGRVDSRQRPVERWTPRTSRWRSLAAFVAGTAFALLNTALFCVAPALAQEVGAPPPLPHLAPASEGAQALLAWHAAGRAAIVRQKPNQQAALRTLAVLAATQQRAADAFARGGGAASDEAWQALFDTVSAQTLAGLMPAESATFARLAEAQTAARRGRSVDADVQRAEETARAAARDALAAAMADRFDAASDVRPPDDPAAWRSLLQPARPPHLPLLGRVATFFLASGDAIRPAAPPAVGSAAFGQALSEVKSRVERGGPAALERAKRWEMVTGSLVAGFWDETAARLAAQHGLSGRQAGRVLAATLGATWDANIACHDAKYTHWTPRPSQVDAAIRPIVALPNHPSYPSNHACDSGAAAEVLAAFFPSRAAELRAMAREAAESRIDGGIHYRFDIDAGLAIGRGAAAAALAALGPASTVAGAAP